MAKLTVKDVDFKGKKVIIRVDFNVPLNEEGQISDDARIKAALPTVQYVLDKGAKKVILMSHLGRPKGKVVEGLRLNPVADRLSQLLSQQVEKLDDCAGQKIRELVDSSPSKVILLENLRFHPEEEKGSEEFARQLASLADVYVNDAFGTAHRAHASTTIIAKNLTSCLGLLMEKEVKYLSQALSGPKPYVVILGGAKVSDKIDVIANLMERADSILVGGAMAYTFLKVKNIAVGSSRVEEDKLQVASDILSESKKRKVKIVLPNDNVVVDNIDNPSSKRIEEAISQGFIGVDIGPQTIKLFKEELAAAKTVLWNGPLGIFEKDEYAQGTKEIALYLAELKDATVIVGGGDSASASKKFGVDKKLAHVSTGGGASLEFLEGKELPGISVIPDK